MHMVISISYHTSLISFSIVVGGGAPGQVIELTPANFDKTVLESDELWLVEFYAPW